jgi:hypothetical protein
VSELEPDSLPLWKLELPLRVSGGGPAGEGFSAVTDIAVDARGRLLVLDRGQSGVLVFDSLGRYERTIGRRGRGPGELLGAVRLTVWGDTICVSDPAQARLEMFSLDGHPLRSVSALYLGGTELNVPAGPSLSSIAWIQGVTATGAFVRSNPILTSGREPTTSQRARVWIEQTRLGRVDTLGWVENGPRWRITYANGLPGQRKQPFLGVDQYAFNRTGTRIVFVEQSAQELRKNQLFRIRTLGPSGERVSVRTYHVRRARVPARAVDSLVRSWGDDSRVRRQARDSLVVPAQLPAVREVVVSLDKSTLIGHGDVVATNWVVLDSLGAPRARVIPPAGFELLLADTDTIWGLTYDSDGVPTIIRYRLGRPR